MATECVPEEDTAHLHKISLLWFKETIKITINNEKHYYMLKLKYNDETLNNYIQLKGSV